MTMDPYGGRGFYDPQSEVNRLFDETFGGLGNTGRRQQRTPQTQWAPALDVVHEGGDLLVRAELPGVELEDVEITFHGRVLTISGERRAGEQNADSGYLVRERRYGPFRRSLVLPHNVQEDRISARFEDGVLEVRVSGGATELEPKRVRIQAPGEGAGG
jgi:HSP20 family protein